MIISINVVKADCKLLHGRAQAQGITHVVEREEKGVAGRPALVPGRALGPGIHSYASLHLHFLVWDNGDDIHLLRFKEKSSWQGT